MTSLCPSGMHSRGHFKVCDCKERVTLTTNVSRPGPVTLIVKPHGPAACERGLLTCAISDAEVLAAAVALKFVLMTSASEARAHMLSFLRFPIDHPEEYRAVLNALTKFLK